MGLKVTRIACTGCTAVLNIPDGTGEAILFGRKEGWTFGVSRYASAKCPRCQTPPGRPGPLQQAALDRQKRADALYALQMAQREKAKRDLLDEIAAQHRASIPHQPDVEKALARRFQPSMYGPGKYGGR